MLPARFARWSSTRHPATGTRFCVLTSDGELAEAGAAAKSFAGSPSGAGPRDRVEAATFPARPRRHDLARLVVTDPEGGHRHDLHVCRDRELGGHGVPVEGAELVAVETKRERLDAHVRDCLPEVIKGELRVLPLRRALDTHLGKVGHERAGRRGPYRRTASQVRHQPLVDELPTQPDDEAPRLRVAGRRRTPGRLEQDVEVVGRQRHVGAETHRAEPPGKRRVHHWIGRDVADSHAVTIAGAPGTRLCHRWIVSYHDDSPSDALGQRLDQLVERGDLAGWVAGVVTSDGHDIRAGGRRALDGPEMTADTQFAMSSSTKPVAGALALRLVEQGDLDLDDPIGRWVPELAEPRVLTSPTADLEDTVPAERAITVRHLLTMTPGFGWVSEPGPLADALSQQELEPGPWGPPMTPDEFVSRLGALPLANQPGTAWRYHTSSDLLGVVLARATGRTVSELLAHHVLEPLRMADTSFVGDPQRLATVYGPGQTGGLTPFPVPSGTFTETPHFESLAAGLVSTVPDQLTFLAALAEPTAGLLSPPSLTAMGTDHVTPEQRATAEGFLEPDCGWGLHVEIRPGGLVGWAGGLGTIGYADQGTGRAAFLATHVSFDAPGTVAAFDAFWTLFD